MKKFIYCFLMLIAACLSYIPVTQAEPLKEYESTAYFDKALASTTSDYDRQDDFKSNCQDFAPTIRIGGYAIFLVKILLPLIIIIKSTLNMMSVITAGAPDDLKKQAKKIATSLIAAIVIFFIPTLLNVIFGFVEGFNENMTQDSTICRACIFEPFSDTCELYAE